MPFTVAIVGRPNVGKSTLYNRLTGTRHALVDDMPGVTRDRREGAAKIGPLEFRILDTAGLEEAEEETLQSRMFAQTSRAVKEAHAVLMMIDGRVGVHPMDRHFGQWLRQQGKPIILLVNKCEGTGGSFASEAYTLGLGEPVCISAAHGEGLADLYQALEPLAEAVQEEEGGEEEKAELQLAIVGRPNAGKSTLLNALLGEERVIAGPEAGMTRDAIAVSWEYKGTPIRLVDTAGMRKKANITDPLEKMAVSDGLRAGRYAQVVVLLLDAARGLEAQDISIAALVIREGRALVIGVNKWDEVPDTNARMREIREQVEDNLSHIKGVPVVSLSALQKRGLDKLMDAVLNAHDVWNRRVTTAKLNRWLEEVTSRHPLPVVKGRRLRLRYATQAKARPPEFILFGSRTGDVPGDYQRYLANSLRDDFDLPGVPIRLTFKDSKNPFAE
ncbi:MAG: ribosome biogenesis GTPase Der [Alphaproteobacteria bacterium]|nr:ribosome biogenesis GTPase Der [Alphaproteobacteria bacterium]